MKPLPIASLTLIAPLLLTGCSSSSNGSIVDRLNAASSQMWVDSAINPDLLPFGATMEIATTSSPWCVVTVFDDVDSAIDWVYSGEPNQGGGRISTAVDPVSDLPVVLVGEAGSSCEESAKEVFKIE